MTGFLGNTKDRAFGHKEIKKQRKALRHLPNVEKSKELASSQQ